MTIKRKKKKGKPMFQEYSKNYVDSFLRDIDECKNNKEKSKVLNKYVLPLGLCSSDTVLSTWLFIKNFKIVILMVLL